MRVGTCNNGWPYTIGGGGGYLRDAVEGKGPQSLPILRGVRGGVGGWDEAMVLVCLPLAAPIGLSRLGGRQVLEEGEAGV